VLQHLHRLSTEHAVKDFLRNLSSIAAARIERLIGHPGKIGVLNGSKAPFVTFGRPAGGK
jgi:hypothetical protein